MLNGSGDVKKARVIFFFGRPASGKTTMIQSVLRYIESEKPYSFRVHVINDYPYLERKFFEDVRGKNFEFVEGGGFRLKNFHILDDCLALVNDNILKHMHANNLILIEFARSNYHDALSLFDERVTDSSSIVYMDATIWTCLQRNGKRADHSSRCPRGYVPDDILLNYYREDDAGSLAEKYNTRFLRMDNNTDNLAHIHDKLLPAFVKTIRPFE